jgi:flagellar basal body rod protein FlgG
MAAPNGITSSLNSLTREFETITNNLANASTVGYKRKCNSFTKSLNDKLGTIDIKGGTDYTQGSLVETGNKLDLALGGNGFFEISTPDGPLYTRNGNFHLNPKGQIVDLEGRLVAGKDGPLVVPAEVSTSEVKVSEDGQVTAGINTVGKLKIMDFGADEAQLSSIGKNCWAAPKSVKPKEAANVTVRQGYQEASNVVVVDELVDLITVNRLYQSNMKMINSESDNNKAILGVAMG